MAFDVGAVIGHLRLETQGATTAANQFTRVAQGAAQSAVASFEQLNQKLSMVGLAMAAAGASSLMFTRSLVGAAAQMESYGAQFKVLTGSAEAARERLQKLTDFAARTPFDLPGVIEADRMLMAFKLDMGGMEKTLTTVGDAAAGMGLDIREVVPILAKLKAGMFETEQMARLGITRDALKQFGIEFTKTGEVVNREDLFPAAIKLLSRFEGQMAALSETAEGRFSNLRDAMFQTAASIGSTILPVIKQLADWVTDTANRVKAWADANPELARTLALVTAGAGAFFLVAGTGIFIFSNIARVTITVVSLLAKFAVATRIAAAATWLWNAALNANPIMLLITAIAGLIALLVSLLATQQDSIEASENDASAKLDEAAAASALAEQEKKTAERADELMKKTKLTAEEHGELFSIMNDIAAKHPEYIRGFDKEGNAIVDVTQFLEDCNRKRREELDLMRQKHEAQIQEMRDEYAAERTKAAAIQRQYAAREGAMVTETAGEYERRMQSAFTSAQGRMAALAKAIRTMTAAPPIVPGVTTGGGAKTGGKEKKAAAIDYKNAILELVKAQEAQLEHEKALALTAEEQQNAENKLMMFRATVAAPITKMVAALEAKLAAAAASPEVKKARQGVVKEAQGYYDQLMEKVADFARTRLEKDRKTTEEEKRLLAELIDAQVEQYQREFEEAEKYQEGLRNLRRETTDFAREQALTEAGSAKERVGIHQQYLAQLEREKQEKQAELSFLETYQRGAFFYESERLRLLEEIFAREKGIAEERKSIRDEEKEALSEQLAVIDEAIATSGKGYDVKIAKLREALAGETKVTEQIQIQNEIRRTAEEAIQRTIEGLDWQSFSLQEQQAILSALLEYWERIAGTTLPGIRQQLSEMNQQISKASFTWRNMWMNAASGIESAFTGLFEGLMSGASGLGDFFKQVLDSIKRAIAEILAKLAIAGLLKLLGISTGPIGALLGFAGAGAGAGAGGGTVGGGGGGGGGAMAVQGGGLFTRPTFSLLGEAGPELVVPLKHYHPDFSEAMARFAGATSPRVVSPVIESINVHLNVDSLDQMQVDRLGRRLQPSIGAALERSLRSLPVGG